MCATVVLADKAAHDAYQDDPIHHDFIKRFADYWIQYESTTVG